MTAISRVTTWASGQALTASALNGEFNNIVNAWNNQDGGTSRWTVIDATTIKKTGFSTNQVLQVIQQGSTTDFTTTSNAFQSTNCANSITPSSTSSKILILASGILRNGAVQTATSYASLFRGSTNLGSAGTNGAFFQLNAVSATGNVQVPCTFVYLDSPSSTSSVSYFVKIANSDNATTIGFGGGNETFIILAEIL